MSDLLDGARANAINIHLDQIALRREEATIDTLVLRYRSHQLSGLEALMGIAEIAAMRKLCSDMDSETREAIEDVMREADAAGRN